jgi:hypothetical protein
MGIEVVVEGRAVTCPIVRVETGVSRDPSALFGTSDVSEKPCGGEGSMMVIGTRLRFGALVAGSGATGTSAGC